MRDNLCLLRCAAVAHQQIAISCDKNESEIWLCCCCCCCCRCCWWCFCVTRCSYSPTGGPTTSIQQRVCLSLHASTKRRLQLTTPNVVSSSSSSATLLAADAATQWQTHARARTVNRLAQPPPPRCIRVVAVKLPTAHAATKLRARSVNGHAAPLLVAHRAHCQARLSLARTQ